jgi:hypothetical protein
MENVQEQQFEKAEIFDTPEQLAASMAQESNAQVESQPEPSTLEQITQSSEPQNDNQLEYQEEAQEYQEEAQEYQEEYSDEEIEAAVYTYLSERLGREINSLEELQSQPAVDERVQAIADFVANTGRKPEDWFTYQSMNPTEMDDLTVVRVQMSQQYPNLSFEEINMLVGNKYKLDPNVYDDQDVQMSMLQLKIDATDARGEIEKIRQTYAAPEITDNSYDDDGLYIDDNWMQNMIQETRAMQAIEFDLGGDKTFTFGLNNDQINNIINRNENIDSFFDNYINNDGSWDYDKLNSHLAVIDNIDTIVASAYRQGLGDGQKAVVTTAANISTDTNPSSSQNLNQENPLAQQVRELLRSNSSKITFKI